MRRQILPFGKHCTANTFQGLNKVSNINYVGHSYKPCSNLNQQLLGGTNVSFQYPMRHFHTSPLISQNNHSGNSNKGWFDVKKIAGAIGIGSIITGVFTYDKLKQMDEKRMKDLYSELGNLSAKCTMNYIQFDDKVNTNKEFKQIEDLLNEFLNSEKLDSLDNVKILDKVSSLVLNFVKGSPTDHLYQNGVGSEHFIYLLHMVNCVANYHMYRNHDGEKAKELLLKGKEAVGQYLKSHYPHELNAKSFDKLSYQSQLKYLNTVDGLAKVYCSTMYLLGRSYTYDDIRKKEAQEQAKEYFEISQYLAQKFGLFEFVLTQRSGMCRIEEQEIKDLINQKKLYLCDTLGKKIDGMIDKFQNLKKVEDGFIEDFNIHKDTQKPINPKQDAYHQVECSEQLLKYYGQAIGITSDQNKIEKYLDNIHNLLVGERNLTAEFERLKQESLKQKKMIPYKKYASVYNTIGNLAVVLSERFECKDDISNLGIKNKLGDLRSKIVQLIKNLDKQTDSENFKHNSDTDSENFKHNSDTDSENFKHNSDSDFLKVLAYDIFKAVTEININNALTINFTEPDAHHGQSLCLNEENSDYTRAKNEENRKNKTIKREHDYTSVLDSCCFVREGGSDKECTSGDTDLAGEEAAL